jgi:hypothetical protein
MLRMRPKPPDGLPTLNAGKPWSEEDLADLNDMRSPSMRREVLEVEAKIAERIG